MPKPFRRLFQRKEKDALGEEDGRGEREGGERKEDDLQFGTTKSPVREEPVDEIPWELLSGEWRAEELLFPEIEEMYWDGVKRELEVILLTMKQWHEQENGSITIPDETNPELVHGFDTFIDQVCEESRNFAQRFSREKKFRHEFESGPYYRNKTSTRFLDLISERLSSTIKGEMRTAVKQGNHELTPLERAAKMLLQSASFLDIEKVIEHHQGEEKRPQDKPDSPQLTLKNLDQSLTPFIAPLACSSCRGPIRSCVYWKRSAGPPPPKEQSSTAAAQKGKEPVHHICEDCYRKSHYGSKLYYKSLKECILSISIPPEISQRMCQCKSVRHVDSNNRPRWLFPMTRQDRDLHEYSEQPGGPQCRLMKLATFLAQAKYENTGAAALQRKIAKRPTSLFEFEKYVEEMNKKPAESKPRKKFGNTLGSSNSTRRISTATSATLTSSDVSSRRMSTTTSSTTDSVEETDADEEIPVFFKNYAQKHPFANVHMALRVGPLLIENRATKGRGGALVTVRDPPRLQRQQNPAGRREVMVNGSSERSMWARDMPATTRPKPLRAIVKQVVGMPFAGLTNEDLELEIIRDLAAASQRLSTNMGGLTQGKRRKILDDLLERLVSKLQKLIGSRAKIYLDHIAERLLDPAMNIGWNPTTNNCQNFCDAFLDTKLFGPLVPPTPGDEALYLMSFVCRPTGHAKRTVESKYDVPMGLTEEYLFKYHYGGPSSDIIDTLQEYWYDWGAFGRNLYKLQDLFPWDCTEAYGRYPTVCGKECNLAKHIWAFPFDSWSITALHLTRSPFMYPPTNRAVEEPFTDAEWVRNRLTVLGAQELLIRVASAMAQSASFRAATNWLPNQDDPHQDRLKLGGIHRAQPYSHDFEHRSFATYLTAPWTLLQFRDQLAAYEELRDSRMKIADVELSHFMERLSIITSVSNAGDSSPCVTKRGETISTARIQVSAPYGRAPAPSIAVDSCYATGFGSDYDTSPWFPASTQPGAVCGSKVGSSASGCASNCGAGSGGGGYGGIGGGGGDGGGGGGGGGGNGGNGGGGDGGGNGGGGNGG